MKKIYRKILAAGIASFFLLALFYIATEYFNTLSREPKVEILPNNNYEKTITVVADIEFDPFSFINENGEPSGYDVELMYAIANKIQFNIDLKLMDWGDCKEAVLNNEAEMIMGNPYNQGGYENLIQSGAITNDPFICIGGENFSNIGVLNDKKLATIVKSGCIIDFLEPYKLLDNTKYYSSYTNAVMSVVSGENDYALVRHSVGNRILAKLPNSDIRFVGPVLTNSLLCIGVNENFPDLALALDVAIVELKNDGTIDSLTGKWLGRYVEVVNFYDLLKIYRSELYIVVFLIIIITAAFVFYSYRKNMKIEYMKQVLTAERETAKVSEFQRTIFNAAPIGLTVFDNNYNFIDCNDAVLAICGVSKEYYINHFFELSPEYQPDGVKSRHKVHEIMQRTLEGEKIITEWMHYMPDSGYIPCEITTTRIKQGDNYIGLTYIYDLRHVRNMEKSVEALLIESQAGNRSKSEFMANMSHEMRTPMNAIMGMTQIAEMNNDPVKIKECLREIDNSSRQLLRLIENVLEAAN